MLFKLLWFRRFVPKFIESTLSRLLAYIRYGVISYSNSVIDPRCVFNGQNVVLHNVEIYSSVIGKCTYIASYCLIGRTKIGKYCSIGDNLRTEVGNHPIAFVSTHPSFHSYSASQSINIKAHVNKELFETHKLADRCSPYVVIIGSDVWVGSNVTILDGVSIGHGAVIAAGAVVTKNVEPYEIVGGVPARHIKYRFPPKDIEYLLNLRWWDKDEDWINHYAEYFHDINELRQRMN